MKRQGRYGVPMQVYGSILPGAATLARLLPQGAREARETPQLSREARRRLKTIYWHEEHGKNVSLTARHYGVSRSTLYLWLGRYRRDGPRGLEDRSHRPRRLRQPTWNQELTAAVLKLREQHPRWGKDKLVILLRRDSRQVSVSMVGRILSQLRKQGRLPLPDLRDPWRFSRSRLRPYATRKPRDYLPRAPGDLVEVDTADVRPLPTRIFKHFTARDVISRWDVLDVHYNATAQAATSFLDALMERMPFPVRAIQVDGGSEFKAEFEAACQAKGLLLFVLPPRSPKLNGHVERAQRTHKEEFYQMLDPPDSIADLRESLRAQELCYNTIRPHQSLGQKTPAEWLLAYAEGR